MKLGPLILSSFLGSAFAVPAIVWKNGSSNDSAVHNSEKVNAGDLFGRLQDETSLAVIFLVQRPEGGNDGLSHLASSGIIPGVQSKYEDAHLIHHHVGGIENTRGVVRLAGDALSVSLSELNSRLTDKVEITAGTPGEMMSKAAKEANKRARALTSAKTVVVEVQPSQATSLDKAVVDAIESKSVGSVVLTAVRSTTEVKQARDDAMRSRLAQAQAQADRRRRLEDEAQQDDDDAGNNDDQEGIHFVAMTPNILAGILFTLMFATVTYIGVGCMGMISGQDVYVTKYPSIGREA